MTRTGPGKNYPGVWLYQRRDLPVRVVKKYDNWRLIQDPDGAQGWMLVTLLSDRRTAIVKPGGPRPIRTDPSDSAKTRYVVEPGVVGRIGKCSNGWCRIEIGKRDGYIHAADIWGVGENEVVD
ncbi:MAG: SH3 domain-containing protein [Pseudomonadota bacterium]